MHRPIWMETGKNVAFFMMQWEWIPFEQTKSTQIGCHDHSQWFVQIFWTQHWHHLGPWMFRFLLKPIDQTDNFSRKTESLRTGQVGKFDYRFVLDEPFPVQSNGAALPAISSFATFPIGHHWQQQTYVIYQFLSMKDTLLRHDRQPIWGPKKYST